MGKLQGIKLTPELRSIAHTVIALPQRAASNKESQKKADENDGSSSSSPSSSPRSASARSPSAPLERAREAKRGLSRPSSTAAVTAFLSAADEAGGDDDDESAGGAAFLPLAGVQTLKYLVANSRSEPDETTRLLQRLESALRGSTLSFAPEAATKSSDAYRKRLERLRLYAEERSYTNLTTNIKNASVADDNVTVKSMTYATSVGLNMIVAPISFGVFMYFFSGSIFSRFFGGGAPRRPGDIDVRRVIAGVISGVFMLFVEMILFVIRSHELDASVRKKARRKENRANPFGYTQKSMERVYVRDD